MRILIVTSKVFWEVRKFLPRMKKRLSRAYQSSLKDRILAKLILKKSL
jgi:hypothetical protein